MPRPCQFSEFTYGYVFTEERMRAAPVRVAPLFPTLRQEKHDGYDVKIAGFGFVQFKRPETLFGNRTRERQLGLGSPIFRMHLNNDQHRQLLRLARRRRRFRGAKVFYACPNFYTAFALNRNYRRRTVLQDSLFIEASSIGRLTPERHHVSYNSSTLIPGYCWLFSDKPQLVEVGKRAGFDEWVKTVAKQPPMTAKELMDAFHDLRRLAAGTHTFSLGDQRLNLSSAFTSPEVP